MIGVSASPAQFRSGLCMAAWGAGLAAKAGNVLASCPQCERFTMNSRSSFSLSHTVSHSFGSLRWRLGEILRWV
jgi:hypothetical protein